MIPVSTAWKQAIKEQFRYQGYLRMTVQVTPPGMIDDTTVSSTDTYSGSTNASLQDDAPTPPTPYISLEPNRWVLNGTFKYREPGQLTDDWWSTQLLDAGKSIVFEFGKPYTIPGMYAEWDVVNNTFPEAITLTGYNLSGDKAYEYNVTDIVSSTGFVDAPMDNVTKIALTITKWNVNKWRCRINELLFGLYASYDSINNGRVVSAETLDKTDPLCSELPTHTCSVSLRNLDNLFDPALNAGISKYLANRQKVSLQWGFTTSRNKIEWTPSLTYYVSDFKIPEDKKEVTISATDSLALLAEEFKVDEYDGSLRTFYDLVTAVLTKLDVLTDWKLSDTLKRYSTYAPIPKVSSKEFLQLAANACGCWIITDPVSGKNSIVDVLGEKVGEVTEAQELGDPSISVIETLYTLQVAVYKYVAETEKSQVAQGTYKIAQQATFTMQYNVDAVKNVSCEVSGGVLVSFTPFGTSATVTVKPNAVGTESEVTITLSGYKVNSSVTYVEAYRNPNLVQGLTVTVDNSLITDNKQALEIGAFVAQWYQRQQKLSLPYIGYPEASAGDTVDVSSVYGKLTDRFITSTKITFNGGFEGTMEVW